MKTSELTGAALDWAVAKCEKSERQPIGHPAHFSPSTTWAHGGPIIERERINVCGIYNDPTRWGAVQADGRCMRNALGPTALVAAMRCFVASRLGDEVEVPAELKD